MDETTESAPEAVAPPLRPSISDLIIHTTVRIECGRADGSTVNGTGFIMNLCEAEDRSVPIVVTNHHVVDRALTGAFNMTSADANGEPLYGSHTEVRFNNFGSLWIKHPNDNIDLAAFPLAPVINQLKENGLRPFYVAIPSDLIADAPYMRGLNAVEDIVMVGYPNGLWDHQNNLPMVRRGVTATPPYIDFQGKPEFVIDCACFPGSSGSPVILFNIGSHMDKTGGINLGASRVKLLGVLWGGPQYTAEGEIKIVPVPTAVQPIALSRIPNNLGFCVKAEQLRAFQDHFEKILATQKRARANIVDKTAE